MECPRLDHFVRLNYNGTVSRCGHMVNAPEFESLDQLEHSQWQAMIRQQFQQDVWPKECVRCQTSETVGSTSIRQYSIQQHTHDDYLTVGGVLDNVCNSACQSCNSGLSTKIGALQGTDYPRFDNLAKFYALPQQRITALDINGGEPTASPNYRYLLQNLPKRVQKIRVNTNGSRVLDNVQQLLNQGIDVTVTVSLDGTGKTHDYVRWPITWQNYQRTVDAYLKLDSEYENFHLNAWTVVHSLNINDLANIQQFAKMHDIDWAYGLIEEPQQLKIQYTNSFTIKAKHSALPGQIGAVIASDSNNQNQLDQFIHRQDQLRNITIDSYIER